MLGFPLLICGDNPALPGGLSRSGRDIASLAATLPEFRVGYLGRGLGQRRKFPFQVYDYPESGGWGQEFLQPVWEDFSGGKDGIILTTDDPSRRGWFATSAQFPPGMEKFLGAGREFAKWGYFPIDSTGPNGQELGREALDSINGFDRVLAASEWGRDVCLRSGRKDADWLPHGLWPVFSPVPGARDLLGAGDKVVVGCVMANQARKDWPVAFHTASLLKAEYGNRFHFWVHTDTMVRYWNLYALAADYGLGDCLEVTMGLQDAQLAARYSAADCTILPSGGEGFGFPIAESLACGTACVVADWGAGQELVSQECKIRPVTMRVGEGNNLRAVLSGWGFANAVKREVELKRQDREFRGEQLQETVRHLYWDSLKGPWTKWLLGGLR